MDKYTKTEIFKMVTDYAISQSKISADLFVNPTLLYVQGVPQDIILLVDSQVAIVCRGKKSQMGRFMVRSNFWKAYKFILGHSRLGNRLKTHEIQWLDVYAYNIQATIQLKFDQVQQNYIDGYTEEL